MNPRYMDEPIYFAPTKKEGGGWIAYKSSPKTPEAPDYTKAAEATAAGNLEAAKYATAANRVNQITPWGSLTWKQDKTGSFNQAGYNTAMDRYYKELAAYNNAQKSPTKSAPFAAMFGLNSSSAGSPSLKAPVRPSQADFTSADSGKWTQTMNLTPESQAALDAQQAVENGRSQAALQLEKQVQGQLATPMDTSQLMKFRTDAPVYDAAYMDKYAKAAYEKAASLMSSQYKQDEERLRNNLALQGLSNTSEAYGSDVGNFFQKKNDAFSNLANSSLLTGNQMANADYQSALEGYTTNNNARASQLEQMMAQYNLPLNQLNALLTGSQVQQPTFSSYAQQQTTPGADYLSAATQGYNAQLGASNAGAASAASSNAGTGQMIGTIASIAATAF